MYMFSFGYRRVFPNEIVLRGSGEGVDLIYRFTVTFCFFFTTLEESRSQSHLKVGPNVVLVKLTGVKEPRLVIIIISTF